MSLQAPDFRRFVRDFTAGFLDAPEADTLPSGATPDARNAFLVSALEQRDSARNSSPLQPRGGRSVLRKRTLAQLVNPTAMVAGKPVSVLVWFEPEAAAAQLLAICDGGLYKFDGIDTFVLQGTGFTAGALVQAVPFKDNVWLTDGVVQKRWNGTALLDVGFDKPTAAPALTVGAATGVTGTYEGFAVWWDSTMDHESSPSDISAAVAFANQKRTWAKPTGTPPANVDFWRIYARRTDTNELNYFLTATTAVATASVSEAVSDTARRVAGPKVNVNDKPPVFAVLAIYKDFGIGVKANESYYFVTKAGDLESVNPNDKFAIERGSGKPLRSVEVFGETALLQKPTKTWKLTGDKPPFLAEPVHTEFGNVGARSAIEVERLYYAWDEQKGPYRTDLETWEPLATNRIATFFATLNLDALKDIQVEHDPEHQLIVWAVPCSARTQTRRRHLLAYNYRLNTWLPPITGLEYSVLARYQPVGGSLGLYAGDYWGRVYKLFEQDREGLPATATILATVTSAASGSVTATGAGFYTTGNGMAGLVVLVESPTGGLQWRRIQSNTTDTITLDTTNGAPWLTVPQAGWLVHLGAVEFYWVTRWEDHDRPDLLKRGGFLFVEGKSSSSADVLTVRARFNQDPATLYTYDFDFPSSAGVWGVSLWGFGFWGTRERLMKKRRINRAFYSMQVRFESFLADTPVDITAFGIEADARRGKRAA